MFESLKPYSTVIPSLQCTAERFEVSMSSKMTIEESLKQYKFPFRRVQDCGLLGCFAGLTPRHKRQAPGSPYSEFSKDEYFSDDEPDSVEVLFTTDSSSDMETKSKVAKSHTGDHKLPPLSDQPTTPLMDTYAEATEESFVFSPPPLTDNVMETPSFRTLSDPLFSTFSYDCASGAKTLARISVSRGAAMDFFSGRPQPLPPPVSNSKISENVVKPVWLPLPAPQDAIHCGSGSVSSSPELRFNSGASSFVSTSSQSSSLASLGRYEIGSWSIRRGKGAPAGGLPLPPPSVATKLLPGLESYQFEELVDATQEFAPEFCMEKGEFGAVYQAWIKDRAGELGLKKGLAVVRLAANDNQTLKDWKSDVQMLAQLPDMNICLIKGYCAHEDTKSDKGNRLERILVFEQSPNGNLHDYLCGSRSKTQLDWSARISIVLGAARGLLYLHDRAPVQILYREFKASSVLLDKDYTPRLAGYGLTVTSSPSGKKFSFTTVMRICQTNAKSNVWSFGIVLLELLTGKCSRDSSFLCDEKNFVQWAAPFLKDESKLHLILDPRMKAKCPLKGALKLADLALRCLKKESQRLSMSMVVDTLKAIKDNFNGRVEHSSKVLEKRRATFGGISFRDAGHRSKVLGHFLSTEVASSVSVSSEDADLRARSVSNFATCALQTGKAFDNDKTPAPRVLID